MLVLVMAIVVIALLAFAVLALAAYPGRDRPLPGAPSRVSDAVNAMGERLDTADVPSYGLLDNQERQRRAAGRFERMERRLVAVLSRVTPGRRDR